MTRRALILVSDKSGLQDFASRLVVLGFEIVSAGRTGSLLEAAGVPFTPVEEVTGFPEMMGGRFKMLHPHIMAGILGRQLIVKDVVEMAEHGILPFDLVVVNLRPFAVTATRDSTAVEEGLRQIDVDGISLIAAAMKNVDTVGIVTSSGQYDMVASEMENAEVEAPLLSARMRAYLACESARVLMENTIAVCSWMTANRANLCAL